MTERNPTAHERAAPAVPPPGPRRRGHRRVRWLRRPALCTALLATLAAGACTGRGEGDIELVRVPPGTPFGVVADSLAAKEIIRAPTLFRLYARATSADHSIRPGTYGFRKGTGWKAVLDDLRDGRVLTVRLVIPEGWDVRRIAPRLARLTGVDPDSILRILTDTAMPARYGVPGPTLEGYLYPATYTLPMDAPLGTVLEILTGEYRKRWTPERRSRADSLGMSEREVVTLASIVEKEAKIRDEMPTIAAVYHNRLRIGYPLQADPTVQYALGEHQSRLLYAHIDSVADHPYNTYRRRGLPPGPIASPSEAALHATLYPAEVPYLYFVARPDGSHIFSRTLVEHNRARAEVRRARSVAAPAPAARVGPGTIPSAQPE